MKAADIKALEFLQQAPEATSISELEDMFVQTIAGYGFSSFGCIHYATPGVPVLPRPLFGRDPAQWGRRYLAEGLAPNDPTLRLVFSHGAPFTWAEAASMPLKPAQKRVFEEAARNGLTAGLVVPVAGSVGEVLAVLLSGARNGNIEPDERATLTALATVLATYGRALIEVAADATTNTMLTSRETECLTWVAQGKTDWEIGAIIGISPRTVGLHIDNARAKLETSTRAQAVFEAWRHGWLISDVRPTSYGDSRIQ